MKKIVNYKVEKKEWEEAKEHAFCKMNKNAKIDGFRPGKAPRDKFEKKYGTSDIIAEATDSLISKRYDEILKEGKIIPILRPNVDLVKADDEGIEVNFTFILDPEITLGDYKGLKVKKEEAKVTKEEVEHELHHLLERYAEMVEKDGKVENSDTAIIDFEGFKDGVAFEGGKGENYPLEIGSKTFIPGFEEAVIGMSKGEEKDIELTFPKDYAAEELKGQKVVFKVKVNDVKTREVPELDKDFFADLDMDGVTNETELKKALEEEIKVGKESELENKYIDDLLAAASKNMKIELDDEIVENEVDRMYDSFLEKMKMQGITEEIYLQYVGTTKEDIRSKMKEEATNRVKYRYLLEEVAKAEKINPTAKQVEKEADDLAKKYQMETEEFLKEFGGLDMVKYDLKMRKAIEVLKENN